MKVRVLLTMAALAGICHYGAAARPAPMQTVAVCMHHDTNVPDLVAAVMTASRLFRDTGVRLRWAEPGSCPEDAIRISLTRSAPDTLFPGAMAYSSLERKQIEVFLNRIERNSRDLQPHLLGYVLAHEITHVIQGIDRHSADGVMKAHWDWLDLACIEGNRLRFTQEDVDLIFQGLDRRAGPERLAAASPHVGSAVRSGNPQPGNLQK